jgi:lipopolysaccharide export system protein LptA
MAAALCVGLLLAAGLAVVVLTRRPHTPPANPNVKPTTPNPEVPPDIAAKGPGTKTARVQFADRTDPSRAAGMIEWASLEPVSQVEKLLTEPRGYIYLRDGGLVIVSSKSGKLNTTPKSEEPQSGRFEGGVTLKLFPVGVDSKTEQPTLTATSDSLDFDIPSASMAATGKFTLRSTMVDIDGSGMRLIVNQIEEGIERFEVAHVDEVVFRPDAKDPLAGKTSATPTQPGEAAAKPQPKGPDRLRTYRTVIDGAVKLTQTGRTMTADRVEAWAHLVNNRIPEGAIGRLGPETAATPEKKPGTPVATAAANAPDPTVHGKWTGRMVVTPVTDTGDNAQPREFGENKIALRLLAGTEPVKVIDDAFKGTMTAARIDFGATTRELTLGSTPAMPVTITTESAGTMNGAGGTVNLGTGRVKLDGPGKINPAASALAKAAPPPAASAKPAEPAATELCFQQSLTLEFATVGDFITRDARKATIKGGFSATSGEVKASADEAVVDFNPAVEGKNTIKELRLKGNAVASAPAAKAAAAVAGSVPAKPAATAVDTRDTLKGQQMTFKFEPDAATGREQPTSVEVTGNAEATAGGVGESGLNLKARTITAKLKDEKGQIAVVSAEANEEVHVSDNTAGGPSTFAASAHKLTVDPATGIAHLYGSNTSGVTVSRDGAVMIGNHLRLTQSTGEVFVEGPGTVSSLKDDTEKHGESTSTIATWTKSMTFNNNNGVAVCEGDASATMTVGDSERRTLQASTVTLNFTPAPKPGEKKDTQRELISAEAKGELGVDGNPPRPATLEERKFSMIGGEQKLEQLIYLEGYRILADQTKRSLDVPVAGKLLVDDRTPEPAKPSPAPAPPAAPGASTPINPLGGFTSSKGTSLFTWTGSLNLDLNKGEAVLTRDVQLTHQPLALPNQPAPPQTTLDCDKLTAFLKTAAPSATAPAAPPSLAKLDATLERVEAVGNIVTKSEGKQLTANSLVYDTVRQFIEAAGKDGTDNPLATFLDPARPAPLRARKFTWDQKNGEIRIIEPAPTTIGQ